MPSFRHIVTLDLSLNPALQDSCILLLEGFIKSADRLTFLNLEKTGITHVAGTHILKWLGRKSPLGNLNLSSNKLGSIFFDQMAEAIVRDGKFRALKHLNVSNTGLADSSAIKLFSALLKNTGVERVYASMNSLRYRTGASIIAFISTNQSCGLKYVDLSYTSISKSIVETISQMLAAKSHCISSVCPRSPEQIVDVSSILPTPAAAHCNTELAMQQNLFSGSTNNSRVELESCIDTLGRKSVRSQSRHSRCFVRQHDGEKENEPGSLAASFHPAAISRGCNQVSAKKRSYSPLLISNRSYDNVRGKIQHNQSIAQDVHPFYTRRVGTRTEKGSAEKELPPEKENAKDKSKSRPRPAEIDIEVLKCDSTDPPSNFDSNACSSIMEEESSSRQLEGTAIFRPAIGISVISDEDNSGSSLPTSKPDPAAQVASLVKYLLALLTRGIEHRTG